MWQWHPFSQGWRRFTFYASWTMTFSGPLGSARAQTPNNIHKKGEFIKEELARIEWNYQSRSYQQCRASCMRTKTMFLDKIWKNQPWWGQALLHLLLLRPIRGLPTFSPPKIWSKFKKIIHNDMIFDNALQFFTCHNHNKMNSNRSSFFCNICVCFWPVRQSRAAVEPNLSLSQNTPIS